MTDEPTIAYPEWTKKGYREASEGDGLVMSRPFRARGTVQLQKSPTLTCTTGCGSGVVVSDDDVSSTSCQDVHGFVQRESGRLRIRYLTPLECWRLMGFPDWAFECAVEAGTSKTQLYKQAGNSIVVPVLQAIFEGMYQTDSWQSKRKTLDDFFGGE